MTKALVVATATFVMLSPAFANPNEAEWGLDTYPSAGECRFVTQQTVTPTGHWVHEQHQCLQLSSMAPERILGP